ncbi:MAG: DUF434 domain-containing protein [Phycisphaerales bacterium]
MPDTREHRGPHPDDRELFAPAMLPRLREALADFSMLLTKGYADKSSLKLVGDRFNLTQRQRLAIMRAACSDQRLESRLAHQVPIETLAGQPIAIDGYNLLITIEAALSGGLIFQGRDGCFRDLASIHGTYRKVEETIPAIQLIGDFLTEVGIAQTRGEGVPPLHRGPNPVPTSAAGTHDTPLPQVLWLLDSPVSNSGRLKTLLAELAQDHGWPWEIRLTISPDAELSSQLTVPVGWGLPHRSPDNRQLPVVVVTTDSVILDACQKWTNLAAEIIIQRLPQSATINLQQTPA